MLIEDGKHYFASQSKDEDYPISINEEISEKYFQLEKIFNSFFPNNYLSLAKEKSKEERDSKKINDSSFTYGEIVFHFLYNTYNPNIYLDIQVNGLYIRIYQEYL